MSITIGSNVTAAQIAYGLNNANSALKNSIVELSSGSSFTSSSSDPGGEAVSMQLSATINESQATQSNIGNAVSMLQTQSGALSMAGNVLTQMAAVAIRYSDPTLDASQKADYQAQYTQLQQSLGNVSQQSFNGQAVFGGTQSQSIPVQTSPDGSQTVDINKPSLSDTSNGQAFGQVMNSANTMLNPDLINQALQEVAGYQAQNGATTSALSYASQNLTNNISNLASANSQISDANVAQVATQYAASSIQTQISAVLLGQANVSSQAALRLLTA